MKVLILSCSTGGGHNSAALALKEQFVKKGVDCELKDMHALIHKKKALDAFHLYSFVAVYLSWLFGALYKIAGLISRPNGRSPVYLFNAKYAKPLRDYMREGGFDTVVCTHLFPAEALTRLRRKYPDQFRFYFVATDYTCSPFNEETKPDYCFIPHADLADEYRGVAPEQRIALGIPFQEKFAARPSAEEKAAAKEALGFDGAKKHALIMCGSMGFGRVELILYDMRKRLGERFDYTVLIGYNQKLGARIDKLFGGKVKTVAFTEHAEKYMNAADVVFTKPGGLSSTEAAACGVPLVHTKPIPGCETKNAKFFSARVMSILYKGKKDLDRVFDLLDESPEAAERRQRMKEAQSANINRNSARDICEFILHHSA